MPIKIDEWTNDHTEGIFSAVATLQKFLLKESSDGMPMPGRYITTHCRTQWLKITMITLLFRTSHGSRAWLGWDRYYLLGVSYRFESSAGWGWSDLGFFIYTSGGWCWLWAGNDAWNTYKWPCHMAWVFSPYGGWGLRVAVPKKIRWKLYHLSKVALEATQLNFCCSHSPTQIQGVGTWTSLSDGSKVNVTL